jgi:hypothetical protein
MRLIREIPVSYIRIVDDIFYIDVLVGGIRRLQQKTTTNPNKTLLPLPVVTETSNSFIHAKLETEE